LAAIADPGTLVCQLGWLWSHALSWSRVRPFS
jgi:hypothetical protein